MLATDRPELANSRVSAVALLVAGAFFMENLDGTVIVTALPQMARSFGVHPVDLNIGVSAYLFTLAVLIPASGWMADRFGTRPVFTWAIVIFTGASILCGLCHNLTAFTCARILQGAGGAMMVPVGRLAVLRTAKKHELISAIATITWPALAAPVLGPPLGGFITTYASWHWVFFLNVPLGLIAVIWALRLLPKEDPKASLPFDGVGFVLSGGACFTFIYSLERVSRGHASWVLTSLLLVGAGLFGTVASFHFRRQARPLIDFRSLRIPSYLVTLRGGSLFRMAISAVPFLLPLLFQIGFGLSPFASGLLVLSVFVGNLVMKSLTTPILRSFPFRTTMLVNGTLNAATLFGCALLTPATPLPLIAALLFVSGLTRSMQFTAYNTLAFADVPEDLMSGANTLFNMVVQMGMAMGIALGAVALRIAALFGPAAPGIIPMAHFHIAFVIIGVVALFDLIDMVGLDPMAGDQVRARRPTD